MKMAVTWNHDAHVLAFRRRERAKQAFDEPYWPVGRTIRWIVKREPDEPEAAHVWTELAHRTSAFAAKYDFWRGPENEQQLVAARLLLNAIQVGRIQPIDENGGIMPREKWAHATPGDWPDVRMLRDEILREFPAEPLSAFPANASPNEVVEREAAPSDRPQPAPMPNGASAKVNVAPKALLEYLKQVADGELTEPELNKNASERFKDNHIPSRVWRAAFEQVPPAQKRPRGKMPQR